MVHDSYNQRDAETLRQVFFDLFYGLYRQQTHAENDRAESAFNRMNVIACKKRDVLDIRADIIVIARID